MRKLTYTGYSKLKDKEITVIRTGSESQLKKQLYYFFEPDTLITIGRIENKTVRLEELMLKDIFDEK